MDVKQLRKEWNIEKREISLGNECYNCGSTENIELHHIVPLKLGGTNNISNIAVLCHKCHMASHYGRHMNEYKNKPQKETIKVRGKVTFREKIAITIPEYLSGKISESECKQILGLSENVNLEKMKFFKQYMK
jgi:hypothetical protein